VPSTYPENPQLATWVKCQRRQYKLLKDGKTSNMSLGRIEKLEELGFIWEMRKN
jgi:Helicase associated domain